jgi:hypothetical protein
LLAFIFGTMFGLSRDDQVMFIAKIGNLAAIDLMEQKLGQIGWPDDFKEHTKHFISGFKVCSDNRNTLMHSGLAWTGPQGETFLFKTTRRGKTHGAAPTLDELRKTADDMHVYADFGRALGNAINVGSPSPIFPIPTKPPLPSKLDYTGEPIPLD